MAEQSPIGTKQTNDFLKKRQATRPTGVRQPIKRVSSSDAPPARGLIRKESSTPVTAKPVGGPIQRTKPVPPLVRSGISRLANSNISTDSGDKPKVKIVTKTLPDGRVVKKRMVMKSVVKKQELTPEEEEQLRLEKERKEKEEAEKRAEAERIRKEREAEEERLRLEREAEAKRKEEERIRLEKEAELKRIEAEKVRQEKERQRIYSKIEYCKGSLGAEDKLKAKQIAELMVIRNIKWNGYISLSSGIGGAVLQ
jgi:hypothetical protein